MLFSNLNLKTKTQKFISLSLTLIGVLFILASKYIGSIAIRLALIFMLTFLVANIKMTYKYLTTKEKINYLFIITASIIGLFRPELIMLIIGILLLYITVPHYINVIKSKDYSDIIMLIIYGLEILFAIYCIINSKAALNTVIKIIGVIFTITGCLILFDIFTNKKHKIDSYLNEYSNFEDTSNTWFEELNDKVGVGTGHLLLLYCHNLSNVHEYITIATSEWKTCNTTVIFRTNSCAIV